MTRITPAMLRFYRRTDYVVGRAPPVRIGARAAIDGVLVSAANPRSRRMPDGWNARMNRRLGDAARRLGPVPAAGLLGAFREEGFLLEAHAARACVLGRRFRQNALVVLKRGRKARLLLLR